VFFLLYTRDFYLPRIEEFDVDLFEFIVDAEPVNEDKTVVKCALFILFHFQNILFTHTNIHFSHILKDHTSSRIINLIQYGCGLISIYLFKVPFKFFDLMLLGEIEFDLLFDDTLLVIVIGNHGQIPKERKQIDGLI
jgi:hypothetical protein